MDSDPTTSHLTSVKTQLPTRAYLLDMWNRRDFALAVPLEELRSQHRTTLLGNLWHLANPLLSIGVYYFVFGTLLHTDRGIDNFLLWLTVGVFAFRLTSGSVLGGATSISSSKGLIRAIKFPRALLPISVVFSKLMSFGIELGVIAVITLLGGVGFSRRLLLLPLIILLHTAINLGGAFIAARLNEGFRDIQQIIPFVFMLFRYLSGVMFPIESFLGDSASGWQSTLISANPLLVILNLYRWAFLGTEINVGATALSVVISFGLLWFGFRYFRAAEWRYGRS